MYNTQQELFTELYTPDSFLSWNDLSPIAWWQPFLSYHFFFIKKNNNIYVNVQKEVCCSHQSDRLGYVSRTNQIAALEYVSRTNQSVVFVLWFERCSNFNEAMGDL